MKSPGALQSSPPTVVILPHDILFDCPKCRKSLAVDQNGEGMIVQCPQCGTDVIVPPKPRAATGPPPSFSTHTPTPLPLQLARMEVPSQITQIHTQHTETEVLQTRLAVLSTRIKELQGQRADLIARMMSHIDEVNRIFERLGGLQGAENEIHRGWDRVVEEITRSRQTGKKK